MKLKAFLKRLQDNLEPFVESGNTDPDMKVFVMATDRRGRSVKIPVTDIWGADGDDGDFELIVEGNVRDTAKPIDMKQDENGIFVAAIMVESDL